MSRGRVNLPSGRRSRARLTRRFVVMTPAASFVGRDTGSRRLDFRDLAAVAWGAMTMFANDRRTGPDHSARPGSIQTVSTSLGRHRRRDLFMG